MSRKPVVDWSLVRRDYEQEPITPAALAVRYNISATAVRNHIIGERWERNPKFSSDEIEQLKPEEVKEKFQTPPPDDITTDKMLLKAKYLVARLHHELDCVTSHIGQLETLIMTETINDRDGSRRQAMLRAISVRNRTATMKDLVTAMKILAEIEHIGVAEEKGKKAQLEAAAKALDMDKFKVPTAPEFNKAA